ncbi:MULTISPECIES: YhcN/YlaJ family sporulation lipoprotein [unclassified Cytobacillus]|uniref:YhcN/YlaJ family sporulation lipoprotein n=1 Tax=unclassified Cytobacillus TaxID=2675268 RepID=UPI00135AFEC5|nr:YhcN/YlaJ family sporulation lipoprotein [Cytobacillus sp. AMY 15.2]KAF0820206.1 putative lipoprotein YlaJ [Bacillus sp. ZZV12-4809]MCM3089439.1 YhcN/YlaJ family sporulation lipoprotein [Cytobacillus sp. AMY 15.2]
MKKVLLICMTGLLLTGCNMNNNQAQNDQEQKTTNTVNVKNSTIQEVDRETGQQVSRHLVDLASRVPNVNDATAVVLGRFAVVGVDVNKNLDRSDVGSIKYSVAETLKNDPHGARAIVVADPDINARLREISDDIENGEPLQGIMNELADIAGRLMPEVPADLVDPKKENEKNATETPKKKLDNDQEKQLEQKQEKQSNFYK